MSHGHSLHVFKLNCFAWNRKERQKGYIVKEEGWRDVLCVRLNAAHQFTIKLTIKTMRKIIQNEKERILQRTLWCFSYKFSYRLSNYKKTKLLWQATIFGVYSRPNTGSAGALEVFMCLYSSIPEACYHAQQEYSNNLNQTWNATEPLNLLLGHFLIKTEIQLFMERVQWF